MDYYSTLLETLENRFEDIDEVRDISNHGITGGFSGFIYSTELAEFFDRYEDDIAEHLEDMGITVSDLVEDETCWTFQEMKERSVWIVVESWCHLKADEAEEEMLEEGRVGELAV